MSSDEKTTDREVRRWRESGTIISPGTAQAIAILWQSSSDRDRPMATLASTGRCVPGILACIDHNLRWHPWHDDRDQLDALRAWVVTVLPMWEHVIYLDGDSYAEWERICYPDSDGVSLGWPDGQDAALDYLRQWDYGEPTDSELEENPTGYSGQSHYEGDGYLMVWHTGLGYVTLYRRLTPEQVAEGQGS